MPTVTLWSLLSFKRSKYAALSYTGTNNLGDEIQTIAAMRFLPRIDAMVDRERLDQFDGAQAHKVILNGWFLHRPEHWPPAPGLKPLFTSFHLTRDIYDGLNVARIPPASRVLSAAGVAYLRRHGPIGARDLATLGRLRESGVEAYFSGCLTLTLAAPAGARRGEDVYGVDIDDDVRAFLEREYRTPIRVLSHRDTTTVGEHRFAAARRLLDLYATARAVVTTRLHCALPCLAFGTPVLLVDSPGDPRFEGLRDFLHRAPRDEILAGRCSFNPVDPPPNGTRWHPLRDSLIDVCRRFVRRW